MNSSNLHIKTNIKFNDGLENVKGRLYGFVTKKDGSWRGCRVDEPKKKIVFVDSLLEPTIIPNVLYSCSLIPMESKHGFIAKSAKLLMFEANIFVSCDNKHGSFVVSVQFGNRKFVYNPASSLSRERDIKAIADILRKRVDLKEAVSVAEEFINHAVVVKRLYAQYKEYSAYKKG